ncbi:hypothetical protein TNCV_1394111 [Trichonephila clavipes]|nr:hypothetical protein TNCV_1394111 [Trichonephila clavipes]
MSSRCGWIEVRISQATVARNLNVYRVVISRLWKQFHTTSIVVRRLGQGRPKTKPPTETLNLTLNARRYTDMTAKEYFVAATGKPISKKTVYRHLAPFCPMVCVPLNLS